MEETRSIAANGADSTAEQQLELEKPASKTAVESKNGTEMAVDDEGAGTASSETTKMQAQSQPDVRETTQPAPLVQASAADDDDAVEY